MRNRQNIVAGWLILLSAAIAVVLTPAIAIAQQTLPNFDPGDYLSGANFNCADFRSQADAQAVLRADPTDPNGLDRDRDGIACERNRAPRDIIPVPRDFNPHDWISSGDAFNCGDFLSVSSRPRIDRAQSGCVDRA